MIRRFIQYYKPQKKLFFLDMVAAFFIAVCDLFYPMITRNMLNDYIPNRQLRLLLIFSAALIAIYFIKMLLSYFVQYYGHMVGVYMQADMRRDLFRHLQKLPFSFFDENETGNIMSRVVNDLQDISELAHHGPEDIFISSVMIIGSFVYLSSINLLLTVIIFLFIPILVWFSLAMRKKMNIAFMESRRKVALVNATLESSISGIRVAKAFTNSAFEEEKFQKGNGKFVKAREMSYRAMGQFFAGTGFIHRHVQCRGDFGRRRFYLSRNHQLWGFCCVYAVCQLVYQSGEKINQLYGAVPKWHDRFSAFLRVDRSAGGTGAL